MPKKKKDESPGLGYKTESQLIEEAKEQRRIEALISAKKKPKSEMEKKAENYWYHYKTATVAGIFILVLAVFFVRDILFRVHPDVSVIMVTSRYVAAEETEALQAVLAALIPDFNGDGDSVVSIDSIPMTSLGAQGQSADPQAEYSYAMKLAAVLASNTDPLYLLDEASYEHVLKMGGEDAAPEDLFLPMDAVPGAEGFKLPLSSAAIALEDFSPYVGEELAFYYRALPPSEKNSQYFQDCEEFLRLLSEGEALWKRSA